MEKRSEQGWLYTFQHHEGWAWLISFTWLAICIAAFLWFGQEFDPGATLTYQEWSDVATVVSAVVAPIAVLWVVRSFYVQKRELAAAVAAATEQTKKLEAQNELLQAQLDAEEVPDMQAELAIPIQGIMDGGPYRECVVTFKNAAEGSAYNAKALAVVACNGAVYSYKALRVDACILGKSFSAARFQTTHPQASVPTLLIRLRTSDRRGKQYQNFWCELSSGGIEPISEQTFIARTAGAMLPD